MNKLTTIALATFLASAVGGAANSKSYNISLDGLCDTMTFTLNKPTNSYGVMHLAGCPLGLVRPPNNPIPGVGIVVKRNPGSGAKYMSVGETQPDGGGAPVGFTYVIDFPFASGGTWLVYTSKDGAHVTEVGSGTYTLH